jgi:hypothetical protein
MMESTPSAELSTDRSGGQILALPVKAHMTEVETLDDWSDEQKSALGEQFNYK